ncbi:hypothetical protein ONE63_003532 [Megalurothrips usitatus]|uniref:DNA-directed DNA polymerase n=1 Tax=Megalurothrips usitatus TaxID=439358 RepID=A0AAV7X6S6_9NEOP|nr:hypothetical protein ONE63_003532 [Megalurothrips usitatus]
MWCGAAFEDAVLLVAHIAARHAPAPSTSRDTTSGPLTKVCEGGPAPASVSHADFTCSTCSKVFKHKRSLARHIREKHNEAPKDLACAKCTKKFKNERTLVQHIKNVHENKGVRCGECGVQFRQVRELITHQRLNRCGSSRSLLRHRGPKCLKCKKAFTSLAQLYRHKMTAHPSRFSRHVCRWCSKRYHTRAMLLQHYRHCGGKREKEERFQALRVGRLFNSLPEMQSPASEGAGWTMVKSAVDGHARVYEFDITDTYDLQLTLLKHKSSIKQVLAKCLVDLRRLKWYMTAYIRVEAGEGRDPNDTTRYARCEPIQSLRMDELEPGVERAILGVINSFDKAVDEDSKILFERVEKLELRVAKLSMLRGSSFIPLPDWLNKPSKGLINIQNSDRKCFLYSCLAALQLPRSHPERVQHYLRRSGRGELCMKGIKYPVKIRDISKFEDNNPGISCSVFGLEGEKSVVPLRVSKTVQPRHINLLLLRDDDDDDEGHYVLIKDLSRFLAHLTKRKRRLFWCENCLTPHDSLPAHKDHRERCLRHDAQAVRLPRPSESILRFTDFEKQQRHDYVIYCDLESVLEPITTTLPDPARSSTTRTHRHVPCGFCYVVVGPGGTLIKEPVLEHGGGDIMKRLLLRLKEEEECITALRGEDHPLDMTPETTKAFEAATHCYLCKKALPRLGVKKCRDHDHTKPTDNYRGAACQGCNVNMKRRDFIPIVMHNLSGYDAHHIISAIGELCDGSDLKAIPKTKERYISFSWGRLRWLDSFGFLASSLDQLVRDVEPEEMHVLRSLFPDDTKRDLVCRKGVYPYTFFDCFERFEETCLPPRKAFRNDLTGEDVSDVDYSHAQAVFTHFGMDSLWDYHDLYLLTDTILLCDVIENFRRATMAEFKVDAIHYYTTPGLAWSAALRFTDQELELLTSIDEYLMWEAGIRGGISSINCRHSKSNNMYIPETNDPTVDSSYVMYYDANSLYGAAMSRPLPVGSFRFLSSESVNAFDVEKILSISESDPVGYLFDVSLEYPVELHDKHNDYPLAPEHVLPEYKNLSPLQKKIVKKFNLPRNPGVKKLIPNLNDKNSYVVFGTTLKLYLDLGLKLKKIHRVMAFEQAPWLAPFIAHCTEKRKQATSAFRKSLFKLFINSNFGKSCENVRKRKNLNFTKKRDQFRKYVRSPLFHSFEIFDHGLVAVERKKQAVCLNRPMYTGVAVLDISKEIMFDFHYNVMKKFYGDNLKLLATDTDSLIYEVKTLDVYYDMSQMISYFDTSDYPPDHPLHSNQNKKMFGKFKDEMNGVPIRSFTELRPKMYAFQRQDGVSKSVGKGIPRAAMKSQLSYEDYEKCLKDKSLKSVSFSKISTDRKHHLFTTFSVKRGLSCYDDKRYILKDNIRTLAYGHYKLRDLQQCKSEDEDLDDEGACNLRSLMLLMGGDESGAEETVN